MWLVVGLGNPGREYEKTRHNVGFEVVETLQRKLGFASWKTSGKALVSRGALGRDEALLVMPQTFMNLSGEAVGHQARFYKVEPGQVVVVHDELDFSPGELKLKLGGGHGGHNGLKSIMAHFSRDFLRVRIGIGKPPSGKEGGANWVLGRFDKHERPLIDEAVQRAAEAVVAIVEDGAQVAMNRFNQRPA